MAPSFGRRSSSAAASTSAAAAAAVAATSFSSPLSSSAGERSGTIGSSFGSSNAAVVSPIPPLPSSKNATMLRSGAGVGSHAHNVLSSSTGSQINSSKTAMATTSSPPLNNNNNESFATLSHSPNRAQGRITPNVLGGASNSFQTSSVPYPQVNSVPLPTSTDTAMAGMGYRSMDSSSIGDTSISPNASPSALSNPTFHNVSGSGVHTPTTMSYYVHGNHSGVLDQQSIHSTNTMPSIQTNNTSTTAINSSQGSTFSGSGTLSDPSLKETFSRRIRSLAYIKRTLSASNQQTHARPSNNQAWLDIVRISRQDLDSIYNSEPMRKRAQKYYLLGCSLASTIELTSVGEFGRSVLAIMQEVENASELGGEKDKTKMRNFFKSSIRTGTARKSAGGGIGIAEISSTYDGVSVGGPSLSTLGPSGIELIGSHVPFPLDFLQTTITLCDILMEIYCKFSLFLNASSNMSSSVGTQTGSKEIDGMPTSGGLSTHESLSAYSHGPISGSSMECMQKVDGKVKKMLMQICKELDGLARGRIREELGSIDPLMARDIGMLDVHTPMIMTASNTPNAGTPNGGVQYLSANGGHQFTSIPMTSPSVSAGVGTTGPNRGLTANYGSIHSNHPHMYTGSAPNLLNMSQHSPGVNMHGI